MKDLLKQNYLKKYYLLSWKRQFNRPLKKFFNFWLYFSKLNNHEVARSLLV